ncbi:long-chain-acyl-CoA synthetase [Afifella sp. IM 167]|uniref:long-chain-acyl-CoA synthetase n=1 Tax=Afifella sp. IM 167 TaxID=2033586 RepID=UPI001CCE532F|nr:long-chain-acyl-CoA synthetase [Afifella sp. IM 167]MBZ8132930.1 long-chain-acyl-CoA synthetase [Afifella sp. IM 167]
MGFINRITSEIAYLRGALRTLRKVTPAAKNKNRTFPDIADELAERFADRPALLSETERWTFRQYNERANQYARWALSAGIKKGDCVALMMPNRLDYMAAWLGIARAGGVTACLNTHLRGPVLANCVNIVEPKHVIVDAALGDAFRTGEKQLNPGPQYWAFDGPVSDWQRLDTVLAEMDTGNLADGEKPKLTTADRCLFIYTSGTTGMPKAANINHYRVLAISFGFHGAMDMKPEDRIYVCLPLYHTTGSCVASAAALTAGASVVIRERFSASQFWDDVVDFECTIFQYIGELCRYLVNSPTHPKENRHKLRLACGNGLRPDIWLDFKNRFHIPKILEWYASTEGNAVFFNFDGKVGSVGRIPKWAEKRFVTEVVRFDYDTEEPMRGPDGFCIKCDPNEVGEVISEILDDPSKPSQRFEGYADEKATKKKILRDVFKKGDMWFRTGDLMKKDALGYVYFIDRIGDTFRWKGENVATSEVSEALTVYPGVKEANVFGVTIPGTEGRAGMVSLVVEEDFDLSGFYAHVTKQLPRYARPIFVRVQQAMDVTGTFKQRKIDLVREGFDPDEIDDPLYVLHPDKEAYVPIDSELYGVITSGQIRF